MVRAKIEINRVNIGGLVKCVNDRPNEATRVRDHNPIVGPEEVIRRTADWMKEYYRH